MDSEVLMYVYTLNLSPAVYGCGFAGQPIYFMHSVDMINGAA
jgi:hypothetical protein